MSPSPDPEPTPPVSNLAAALHRQQRVRSNKVHDTPQPRGRDTARHELGRRDRRDGRDERVTRIYPRDVTKSPSTASRLSSASPPAPPAYNATTSPLLSALGATRGAAAQYTNEWTMSHSPPGMRPLSHPSQNTTFGGRMQHSPRDRDTAATHRRASMYSHHGPRPPSYQFASNPPLPHQPQAHFYGLPELRLGLDNTAGDGVPPGERGYFCGFDTLALAGDEAARAVENVLLVGQQGGLDVFRVEKGKLDIIARLEGLQGAVISAKVLPWTSRRDPLRNSRPLVAVTLHGPVLQEGRSSQSGSGSSSVVDDSASESPSRPAFGHGDSSAHVTGYQTSVEIYSLKERRRLAILYRSPLVALTSPITSPMFQPPSPVGEFVVDAKGKFVVVASGSSGEVFIFAPYLKGYDDYTERYRCIGKVWTSVQLRERPVHSSASSAADGSQEETPLEKYRVPVFSLSDRWLSVTPPGSTTLYALDGVALTSPYYERPPGITHHTVPPPPSANCTVEAPEPVGLIDRLAREGTQVAIKGARWATEKGMQAFKAYMNKTPQPNGATNMSFGQDPAQHYFPPTHGHNQTQPRQETAVISVYDLQRLLDAEETRNKSVLYPIATIPATLGCSFLSFSPSGLMLMTVSNKGDYQDVWDLKRMTSRRARKTWRDLATGPHVRQVARFARMTVTNVMDVVWSAPRMDKLAVITDKGTVHMFLMPASAFQWPPPRRLRTTPAPVKPKEDAATAGRGSAITSAMQTLNGTAKPWLDAVRTRNPSGGARFSLSSLGVTPAAGAKSGKAVAAGVGKSINNIRHAGDNKLALPQSPSGVRPYSVRWLSGKGRGSIAIVSAGVLQIWRVQMRSSSGRGQSGIATAISKKKVAEFGLAPIRDTALPPSVAEQLFSQPGDPDPIRGYYGEWIPRSLPSRKPGSKPTSPPPAPLSFSEIETNPPYQPFYTDRRLTRFIYSRPFPDVQGSTTSSTFQPPPPPLLTNLHTQDDSPWLFGNPIQTTRLSSPPTNTHSSSSDNDTDNDNDSPNNHDVTHTPLSALPARLENKLTLCNVDDQDVEHVVVTTRRRRGRRVAGDLAGDEGFFEDDCEVLDFAEDRV